MSKTGYGTLKKQGQLWVVDIIQCFGLNGDSIDKNIEVGEFMHAFRPKEGMSVTLTVDVKNGRPTAINVANSNVQRKMEEIADLQEKIAKLEKEIEEIYA